MPSRPSLPAAGVTPVAKPEINLNALGMGFGKETEFLTVARSFEDLGVTALAGAAQVQRVSSSSFIGTLARLIGTEAEHAGNIRLQIARLGIQLKPLDGVDILPPPASGGTLFSVDSNGLTAVRTPGQILFVAYGMQANVNAGGFFPMGVNGSINMSSDAV